MNAAREALIRERLSSLEPTTLQIIDESHLHVGHEGSRNGAGHYRVIIASPCFTALNAVARHRLVYDRLNDLIPFPVHALAIVTRAA